mmetsp:Transcript_16823/g.36523  ORF Transcript_16823/g.36523 Transcript_16823/m.36523 type:complete len:90 (-) Transcript_16823:687-956(-)
MPTLLEMARRGDEPKQSSVQRIDIGSVGIVPRAVRRPERVQHGTLSQARIVAHGVDDERESVARLVEMKVSLHGEDKHVVRHAHTRAEY